MFRSALSPLGVPINTCLFIVCLVFCILEAMLGNLPATLHFKSCCLFLLGVCLFIIQRYILNGAFMINLESKLQMVYSLLSFSTEKAWCYFMLNMIDFRNKINRALRLCVCSFIFL